MARSSPKPWRKYYDPKKRREQRKKSKGGLIVVPQPGEQSTPQGGTGNVSEAEVTAKANAMGIKVGSSFVTTLGAEWALDELNRIDNTMSEFGLRAGDYITEVNAGGPPRGYGSAIAYTFGGSDAQPIIAVSRYYGDKDYLIRRYNENVASGYHPKGTTYEDVLIHETGHRIEAALAKKAIDTGRLPYAPNISLGNWNNYAKTAYGSYATEKLISQAAKNIKKTPYGAGKSNYQLYRGISGYAAAEDKRSETFAEAIADWRRNGSNANPLSIEIVRLTKEYLNS